MKTILLACTLPLLLALSPLGDGILAQLGMDEKTAQKFILNNFVADFGEGPLENTGGSPGIVNAQLKSFRIPPARFLPAVIKGDRIQAAKDLCDYVQAYVNSEHFAKAYAEKRATAKPTALMIRPDEATIRQQEADLNRTEKEIEKLKANKQLPSATLKEIEAGLTQQRKMIADWRGPDTLIANWEKAYPADLQVMIRMRLQEYLQLAATVDFNAALTTGRGSKRIFVNPAYEAKSLKWKAIYRAGKDVNDVLISFSKDWLKRTKPSQ